MVSCLLFAVEVGVGLETALEGMGPGGSFLGELYDLTLIEHFMFFLVGVEMEVGLAGHVAPVSLLVEVGFPSPEVVPSRLNLVVLFESALGLLCLELRGLHESAGVPGLQPGHTIEWTQF